MPDLDALYQALIPDPKDWTTLRAHDDWVAWGILADWYEEYGPPEVCAALRWMIEYHKRPFFYRPYNQSAEEPWRWFDEAIFGVEEDPESSLSPAQYRLLSQVRYPGVSYYSTLQAAVEDLAQAWTKAPAPRPPDPKGVNGDLFSGILF